MSNNNQTAIDLSELVAIDSKVVRAEAEIDRSIGQASVRAGQDISWQEDARCRDELADLAVFYPEKGMSNTRAKMFCGQCAVRIECLNYALRNNERYGVWGGLSEKERRQLRRMAS